MGRRGKKRGGVLREEREAKLKAVRRLLDPDSARGVCETRLGRDQCVERREVARPDERELAPIGWIGERRIARFRQEVPKERPVEGNPARTRL